MGARKPAAHVLSTCCVGGGRVNLPLCQAVPVLGGNVDPNFVCQAEPSCSGALPCTERALEDAQEMAQNLEAKLGFCPRCFCVGEAPDQISLKGNPRGRGWATAGGWQLPPFSEPGQWAAVPRETFWTVLGAR